MPRSRDSVHLPGPTCAWNTYMIPDGILLGMTTSTSTESTDLERHPLTTTTMKSPLPILALLLTFATAQSYPECTAEVARTDACAAVIDANACYNKVGFRNAQTLTCIDGTSDADKKKKVSADFCILVSFGYELMSVGVCVLQVCWGYNVQLGDEAEVLLAGYEGGVER
jgi:hypothetical protein